jgi:hypothetical protein
MFAGCSSLRQNRGETPLEPAAETAALRFVPIQFESHPPLAAVLTRLHVPDFLPCPIPYPLTLFHCAFWRAISHWVL